ncbi:BA75_01641T0 [Komagataella pastoris]|uniref:BA75_01641T0 n=1 Tax=Komagataella pastoris TaxID=4922 RepID=A0A1B2J6M1_PICPA|nr:BA75_01641T0 [Komagataella pastoris]
MPGVSAIELLVLTAVFLTVFHFIIYPLYFHPLSKVPGPKVAAITRQWILYQTWSENRNKTILKLHHKYGTIVRIGPNEVDISDASYIKDIYVKNLDKSTFYRQFGAYGAYNTFSEIEKTPHLERKKLTTKFYSKTNVATSPLQSRMRSIIDQTIDRIKSTRHSIDVYNLFQQMALDVMCVFSFGTEVYDKPLVKEPEKAQDLVNNFRWASSTWFWTTLVPFLEPYVISQHVKDAACKTAAWVMDFSAQASTCADLEHESKPLTLVGVLKSSGLDMNHVAAEVIDHVVAGHETTGITLAYLLYELAANTDCQRTLKDELKVYQEKDYDFSQIDVLPYLEAVLQETFRLHAAIPGQEPRVTPVGGMKWRGNEQVPSMTIPSGTIVTMEPWTLHRDDKVFPDPLVFKPERWLADEHSLFPMKRQILTFGAGVRMCIGKNLAIQEMKLLLVGLLRDHHVGLDPSMDYESDVVMADKYTTHPANHRLFLTFCRD